MSDLLPQEPVPEPAESRRTVDQAADIARSTFSLLKSILFLTPLLILIVVVALALMGPAVSNIFSNVVNSL